MMEGVNGLYLAELFAKLDKQPIWEIMRDDERARGNRIIVPGEVAWLPAEDWDETVVVSISGKEVRLIAILARNPGAGSFRRLVDAVLDAGLFPVILAPTVEMAMTMKRWNWTRRYVGSGWEQEEQWRPRKRRAA